MAIAIIALVSLIFTFLAMLGAGLIIVILAWILGRVVPPARDACQKSIAGWTSKRGLRNRLVLAPVALTLVLLAGFLVLMLNESFRLKRRIMESTRVILRSGGNCHRAVKREGVIVEIKGAEEIGALAARISIIPTEPGVPCRCCGNMTFDCYQGEKIHYSFSVHHGERIRIQGSFLGDRKLTAPSQMALNQWLEQIGAKKTIEKIRAKAEAGIIEEIEKSSAKSGTESGTGASLPGGVSNGLGAK